MIQTWNFIIVESNVNNMVAHRLRDESKSVSGHIYLAPVSPDELSVTDHLHVNISGSSGRRIN